MFVGIVRHPGGCVASNSGRWRHSFSKAAFHYERYARELARQADRHADRFVLVRYEDLVLRPEPLLRELLDWLGEPWSDQVLRHHAVQARRGGRKVVEGRSRVTDPIDVSRIAKWTRTLDAGTRRRLERRLGRLGELFGYAAADPAVLEPLRAGSLLAHGADVRARIDRFADLDVRTRMEVPKYERLYHPRDFTLAERPVRKAALAGRLRRAAVPIVSRLPRTARRALSAGARALEVERQSGRPAGG